MGNVEGSEKQPIRGAAMALAGIAIGAAALSVWLFPRAFPMVALEQHVTRDIVLQRADSFFAANALAPAQPRTSVRFVSDEGLITFIDLAGGGDDTLNALVRGRDVTPFEWSVRAFLPGDVHEARVSIAPDGRVIGFYRRFAEADTIPSVSPDSGERLARHILTAWLGEAPSRWTLATTSYEIQKTSHRIDRTYTFERVGRRVADAPIRLDIEIDGNAPARASPYVEVPETFDRRYAQMRSANEAIASGAQIGMLVIAFAGAFMLWRGARARRLRWRGPLIVGAVIGALLVAAALNDVPGSWYDYDTATSATVFFITTSVSALAAGAGMGAVISLTLVTAESVERLAFPAHPDWWKLWANRGTREVAGRVAGGYAVAAIDFAYVALFYIVTRRVLGWWVPSELLDDPNQIASPMPWVTGIANSLQAGVWEEALFRALPLSLFSLWVGTRPRRGWWMAGGVVVTALIFGFAHANYESWPPYSRGVEIFLDACLWGAIFLRFGILVTVVAHFLYDLVLFALFTASGTAMPYRVAGGVMLAALVAPAIAIGWRWARQRRLLAMGDDGRMRAWTPEPAERFVVDAQPTPSLQTATPLGTRGRAIAVATIALGTAVAIFAPDQRVLGVPFTLTKTGAEAVADSMMRARNVPIAGWTKFAIAKDGLPEDWGRFLSAHRAARLADSLARSYEIPARWVVRYVHTAGTTAERAEEWDVRVFPEGAPLDVRHVVPDSAHGDSLSDADARRIARQSLATAGLDSMSFVEAKLAETPRPARRDVDVTFTDTTVKLPADAAARAIVSLAGSEPVLVHREVELPESFERADTKREDILAAIRGVCALVLSIALLVGSIVVLRTRPPVVAAARVGTRTAVGLVAGFAALEIAGAINKLPIVFFGYDTSTPWSTFLVTTWMGVWLSGIGAFLLLGLAMLADALRRRAGIPLLPTVGTVSEEILPGIALGVFLFFPRMVLAIHSTTAIPAVPQSLLDQAVPVIAPLLQMPTGGMALMLALAIPALIIVALGRGIASRVTLTVVLCVLASGIAFPDPQLFDGAGVLTLLLTTAIWLVALGAAILALRTWGARSAWSWIVASLTGIALGALHQALHAPTGVERAAHAIDAVIAALALGVWARRLIRRRSNAVMISEIGMEEHSG